MKKDITISYKAKVVVVEDNEIITFLLKTLLTDFGCHVVETVQTGKAGFDAVQRHRPDLVFMDIFLEGDMTGIEAAKLINNEIPTPIIFMTASDDQRIFKSLREVESYACIQKPFTELNLRFTLENVLHLHQTKEALKLSQQALTSQLSIEAFASSISNRFIHLAYQDFSKEMNSTLRDIVSFANCDSCYILLLKNERRAIDMCYRWHLKHNDEWTDPFIGKTIDAYPWLKDQLNQVELVVVHDVAALPDHALLEKGLFNRLQIRSFLAMPLLINGKPSGLLFINRNDDNQDKQEWSEDKTRLIRRIGEIFSNALSRNQVEKERQDYQDYLQHILNAIQSPIAVKDDQHNLIFMNDAYCQLTGLDRQQLIGKNTDPVFKESKHSIIPSKEYLKLHRDETTLVEVKPPNEMTIRTYNHRKTVFQNLQGESFFVNVAHDISALRLAEEKLLFTQHAVDVANIGIMWVNSSGHIIYVNQAACRFYGYSQEEMCHQTIENINPNIETKGFTTYWNDIRIFGSKIFQTAHKKKSGELFPVEVLVSYLDHRNMSYLCYFVRDITLRKQAEEGIRVFKSIFDHANFGMCVFDIDQTFVYLNDYMAMIHGYTQEEVITKPYTKFYDQRHMKTISDMFNAFFTHGTEFNNCEVMHKHRNGKLFPMLINGNCIRSDDGVPIYFSVSAVDISELTRVRIDLEKINQSLIQLNNELEKRVEARTIELKQSEAQYRLLIENQTELVIKFDSQFNILYASPSYCNQFDASKPFTHFIYANDQKEFTQYLDRLTESHQESTLCEIRAKVKNAWLWFGWSFNLVQDRLPDDDKEFIGVGRDITNRKIIEQTLEMQNIILKSQQEASMDGILIVNSSGDIQSYNQRLLDMWDVPPSFLQENIIQQTINNNIPLAIHDIVTNMSIRPVLKTAVEKIKDPAKFLSQIRYLFETKTAKSRNELQLKDGRYFDRYTAPLMGNNGKFYGRAWYFRDITDQKKAEQEIINQHRFIENIIQSMLDCLIVMSMDASIMKVNKATLSLTGYSETDILNKPFAMLVTDPSLIQQHSITSLPQIIETMLIEQSVQNQDLTLYLKSGEYIPVSFTGYVMTDHHDKAIGMVAIIRDMRELREATARLIQTEKLIALGEMSAGVAHELKQPLNVIKIISQSILRDVNKKRLEEDELSDNLGQVTRQVNKMSEIIDHMRIFSRRSDATHLEDIQVNQVIENAFSLFQEQFKIRGIDIHKNLAHDLPDIKGDPIRLEQVMTNLISNARKALEECNHEEKILNVTTFDQKQTHEGKSIHVIVIEISDTGTGIPDHHQAKIFEHFFTTRKPGEGTGLGLAITKTIIEEHHGKIEYIADWQPGAKFRITLPVQM